MHFCAQGQGWHQVGLPFERFIQQWHGFRDIAVEQVPAGQVGTRQIDRRIVRGRLDGGLQISEGVLGLAQV